MSDFTSCFRMLIMWVLFIHYLHPLMCVMQPFWYVEWIVCCMHYRYGYIFVVSMKFYSVRNNILWIQNFLFSLAFTASMMIYMNNLMSSDYGDFMKCISGDGFLEASSMDHSLSEMKSRLLQSLTWGFAVKKFCRSGMQFSSTLT